MTRPLRGPLNPTETDHSTDAYDTIDWLVKHVPESNGRVGMIGSSYEGFTVVMGLVHPHPALKVAAPESPMVDGWMGDDWFHYGAFRQSNLDYFAGQTTARGAGTPIARQGYDDYDNFLRAGSTEDFARAAGLDQLPGWRKVIGASRPTTRFWREQALDRIMGAQPLTVPTMWIQGLWDQEDMWGAIHSYAAVEPKDAGNDKNFLVMGPWRHSQTNYNGTTLGPMTWRGDTALEFRRDVLKPFFDQYLKEGAPKASTPPVFIYNTGENHWDRFPSWPLACESGCATASKPLYLTSGFGLSFQQGSAASGSAAGYDEYVSDPAKPVPFIPRPARFADGDAWRRWLLMDQRFVADRPDVLSYVTPVLTEPVRVSGAPVVHLVASTSGTDADWVVKLIDVYPDEVPSQPEMGGYQLGIAMDIFRGRYRESFETAKAIPSNTPVPFTFALPTANHVFLPGHRIMVQVQSTWFPLYDRNPQTFVPNIFLAKTRRLPEGDDPDISRRRIGEFRESASREAAVGQLRLRPNPVPGAQCRCLVRCRCRVPGAQRQPRGRPGPTASDATRVSLKTRRRQRGVPRPAHTCGRARAASVCNPSGRQARFRASARRRSGGVRADVACRTEVRPTTD